MLRLLFLALTVALVAAVARWGGAQERRAAVVLIGASLASLAIEVTRVVPSEAATRLIDVAILAYLLWLALRSDRFWPMWAAAFQAVAVALHVVHVLRPGVWFHVYASAGVFWVYPIYLAVIAGASLESRDRPVR